MPCGAKMVDALGGTPGVIGTIDGSETFAYDAAPLYGGSALIRNARLSISE